jgi:hypothetical protein
MSNVDRPAYSEVEAPPGELKGEIMDTMVGHGLWVLVSATISGDEDKPDLNLKVETGGMVPDTDTLRSLLRKTLEALP